VIRGRLGVLAAVLAASAALGWVSAQGGADAAVAPDAAELLPVESRIVQRAPGYEVRERFAGRVVSRRTSELGFERGGLLVEVLVDEGDRVSAGQRLARLDTRQLEARRRELGAELESARARASEIQARLALARLTLERRERLRESDHIAEQRYDEARFEVEALRAQMAAARAAIVSVDAAIERVDVDLDLSSLEAPYAGSITARRADEGSVVSPGQTLLQLIEDGALEARIGLPAATANRLRPEGSYAIEVEGVEHSAALDEVLETIDPETRTVIAIFRFDPPPKHARDGALARLTLDNVVEGLGFWLPITALTESRRGLWSAFALIDDGGEHEDVMRVERRELQVIHAEADRAFVRGTLRDGERVVVTGLHRLVPGQRVRVAR
jgi:RND family efflux transporter MFP subunit